MGSGGLKESDEVAVERLDARHLLSRDSETEEMTSEVGAGLLLDEQRARVESASRDSSSNPSPRAISPRDYHSMSWARRLRKNLTLSALTLGMRFSQRAKTTSNIEALRRFFMLFGRVAIPLRSRVARSMRRAGVYQRGLVDEYFRHAIEQLCMLSDVFRAGFADSCCPDKFKFDDSFKIVELVHCSGAGPRMKACCRWLRT